MFKKITYIAITLSIVLSSNVGAIDELFYSQNNIVLYNPDDKPICQGSGSGVVVNVTGETNAHKIWNFLAAKGYKDFQIAGVLGNMYEESGFSATRQEQPYKNGKPQWPNGGYGIVQWTGARRDSLERTFKQTLPDIYAQYYNSSYGKFAGENTGYVHKNLPVEVSDKILAMELDILDKEMNSRKVDVLKYSSWSGKTEAQALKDSTTLAEASDLWLYNFERPKIKNSADRIASGEKFLKKLKGSTTTPAEPTTGDSTETAPTTGEVSEDCIQPENYDVVTDGQFQKIILDYAHHTYLGKTMTMKPEYVKAVRAAKKKGSYIGGCNGVDCGGFVTRVVRNSGIDPTYNKYEGSTFYQSKYLKENWVPVAKQGSIDTSLLQPGDVAMMRGRGGDGGVGHTFIYVGDIPGFKSKIASSSLCNRAPMAGKESLTRGSSGRYLIWYRMKK